MMRFYLQVLQRGREDHGDPLDPVDKTDEIEIQHGNFDPDKYKQHDSCNFLLFISKQAPIISKQVEV